MKLKKRLLILEQMKLFFFDSEISLGIFQAKILGFSVVIYNFIRGVLIILPNFYKCMDSNIGKRKYDNYEKHGTIKHSVRVDTL